MDINFFNNSLVGNYCSTLSNSQVYDENKIIHDLANEKCEEDRLSKQNSSASFNLNASYNNEVKKPVTAQKSNIKSVKFNMETIFPNKESSSNQISCLDKKYKELNKTVIKLNSQLEATMRRSKLLEAENEALKKKLLEYKATTSKLESELFAKNISINALNIDITKKAMEIEKQNCILKSKKSEFDLGFVETHFFKKLMKILEDFRSKDSNSQLDKNLIDLFDLKLVNIKTNTTKLQFVKRKSSKSKTNLAKEDNSIQKPIDITETTIKRRDIKKFKTEIIKRERKPSGKADNSGN